MNLLELMNNFGSDINFIGDNEQDKNQLTIHHYNNMEVTSSEHFMLTKDELEDLVDGLEILACSIRGYLENE